MKKFVLASALFGLLGLAFLVPAGRAAPGNYGDAGCGLGSMLWSEGGAKGKIENRAVREILASTTNGTFSSQTFGITTGISNCTEKGLVLREKEQELFVEANQDQLAREAAAGQGEYLTALASVMGCGEASQSYFAGQAKARYAEIFGDAEATPVETLDAIKTVIRSDAALAAGCAL